jgi:hypothetical protein
MKFWALAVVIAVLVAASAAFVSNQVPHGAGMRLQLRPVSLRQVERALRQPQPLRAPRYGDRSIGRANENETANRRLRKKTEAASVGGLIRRLAGASSPRPRTTFLPKNTPVQIWNLAFS